MQGLDTLNIGGSLRICPKMQVGFSKKWNIEMAAVSNQFRQCHCPFELRLCRCYAACYRQEVPVERHRTWIPFVIDRCLYSGLEMLFSRMPITPAEIEFGLCLYHHCFEPSIIDR